ATTDQHNSMARYSGNPLPKKLGIKPNYRAAFLNLPAEVKAELHDALSACHFAKDGRLDFAMIFTKDKTELKKQFSQFAKQLAPSGMLWVSWPKKSSGVASVTTRSMSSQGAGLPVQISNWRAAWWTNISIPGITCAPRALASLIRRVSGGS